MEAEFQQLRNDLYWTWYHSRFNDAGEDLEHHFEKLSWTGYDDANWWNNVATKQKNRQRKCKCGEIFEINYETNEVTEVSS